MGEPARRGGAVGVSWTGNSVPHGTSGPWRAVPEASCAQCERAGRVEVSVWESDDGAYEDYNYRCVLCGHSWWVDGIDS